MRTTIPPARPVHAGGGMPRRDPAPDALLALAATEPAGVPPPDIPRARWIPLHGFYARGTHTLVDADLFDRLSAIRWRYDTGYAVGPSKIKLDRHVVGYARFGYTVDHINGFPLDNRRANLRFATWGENSANTHRLAKLWGGNLKYGYDSTHTPRWWNDPRWWLLRQP